MPVKLINYYGNILEVEEDTIEEEEPPPPKKKEPDPHEVKRLKKVKERAKKRKKLGLNNNGGRPRRPKNHKRKRKLNEKERRDEAKRRHFLLDTRDPKHKRLVTHFNKFLVFLSLIGVSMLVVVVLSTIGLYVDVHGTVRRALSDPSIQDQIAKRIGQSGNQSIRTVGSTTTPKPKKPPAMVYAQVMFRNGETVDDLHYSDSLIGDAEKLNARGANNSKQLGKLLKTMYVDTGLLDPSLNESEMAWFSKKTLKGMETAEKVSSEMFEGATNKVKPDTITSDKILKIGGCNQLIQYNMAKFPNCPNTAAQPTLCFLDAIGINSTVLDENQKMANMFKNGDNTTQEDVMDVIAKYETAFSNFDIPNIFQLKFYQLVGKLSEDVKQAWDLHQKKQLQIKFRAYSAEDYNILGVLHAFKFFGNEYDAKTLVDWNSFIAMELWEIDEKPFVKFAFKKDEVIDDKNSVQYVQDKLSGCEQSTADGCPLEKLYSSANTFCGSYRGKEFIEACKDLKVT